MFLKDDRGNEVQEILSKIKEEIEANEGNKNMSQSQKAYLVLNEAIQKLILKPGTPLFENDFSEYLNMSRTPIREAIHRLENDGLVVKRKGKGAFVKTYNRENVRQIYEIVEALESQASFLAANRYENEDLRELEQSVNKMIEAKKKEKFSLWIEGDQKFHNTLPYLCNNPKFVEASESLYGQINLFRMTYLDTNGIDSKSVEEHKKTFEAIKNQKGEIARKVTFHHWQRIRKQT